MWRFKILLLLLCSCSIGRKGTAQKKPLETQVELIKEKMKAFPINTQLSVAFVEEGAVYFYGIKKESDQLLVVENKAAVFEIGSISKVFTATLLAELVEDKSVALADPIPVPLKDGLVLTFQSLANHSSGLPRVPNDFLATAMMNPNNPYAKYDTERFEKYLVEGIELTQEKGQAYEYSNLGASLLAYALSQVTAKNYQTLLEEQIFSKYGMTQSSTIRSELESQLIPGLNNAGQPTSNWDFGAMEGAGAILSTTEDLSKFVLAQFDSKNKALALTQQSTFTVSDRMDMGLGWHILNTKLGNKVYWHNGGTGGYTSSLTMNVEHKVGVVILSNVSALSAQTGLVDDLCFELIKDLILGVEPEKK